MTKNTETNPLAANPAPTVPSEPFDFRAIKVKTGVRAGLGAGIRRDLIRR
ncbi:MAG: hypothetical protein H6721_01830 [Sandaracinus sp.]|nr:hypothetical protein [Sandaracinus sp.]MCB9611192.1 hypothetical protein [Sandaracinus sp.]MCB9621056.1 hypothetical protein [Sandaracinus sp.]MCB9623721.1 hypothetical protein [Sandaracinus sp.]MCB9630882.1 hypothetical protein [Sandaracinus sp.]